MAVLREEKNKGSGSARGEPGWESVRGDCQSADSKKKKSGSSLRRLLLVMEREKLARAKEKRFFSGPQKTHQKK